MKILTLTLICLLSMNLSVMADDKMAAKQFLESKVAEVIAILSQKELDKKIKERQVTDIITPMFDFPLMAKLSVGPRHWPKLGRENQKEFTQLFFEHMKASYLEQMFQYNDEQLILEAPIKEKRKIYIPTHFTINNKKFNMLYKLYKPKDSWRIYDIEIQGVSTIRSYRSQFTDILKKGTVEDLLNKLRPPTKTNGEE